MGLLQLEIGALLAAAFLIGAGLLWLFSKRPEAGRQGAGFAKLGAVVTALLFPFLCVRCIGENGAAIRDSLRDRVTAAIKVAPVAGVGVTVDGRDVTLTGELPSQALRDSAGAAAVATTGVRKVENNLTVAAGSEAAAVQAVVDKITADRKIEFEPKTVTFLPQSIPVLEELSKVLSDAPTIAVRVEGYTDNSGNEESNRALSKQRAQAVVQWFSEHGVSRSRLTAAGFGPDKPIAPNDTREGRAKNRRIEIITN